MMRAKFFLNVSVWILTFLATAGSAVAAIPDGSGPYTVNVVYDDTIYIDYRLNGVWHRSLVPIGGAYTSSDGPDSTPIAGQLYCLDPTVPYYDVANITNNSDETETVTMSGYSTTSLSGSSVAIPQNWNWNAVNWLIVNGYQGNYSTNDLVSQDSVERLQALYPALGTAITPEIALIATKVALWEIVAGDNFEFLDTSLSSSSDKTTVNTLIQDMVASAQSASAPTEPVTSATNFKITLDDSSANLTSSGNYQYYGPITVHAELDNPNRLLDPSAPSLDKIFLTVTGTNTAGIQLVSSPGGTALPSGTDPSYDGITTATPYISNVSLTRTDSGENDWSNDSVFYLEIPASRTLGSGALTIDAVAGITYVSLAAGTPLIFMYENNGEQDWNAIQPFIGLATSDQQAFLYAAAQLIRSNNPSTAVPVPALNDKSLLILAMFVLLLYAIGYGQQRKKRQ